MRRDTATITIAAAAITLQDQATPSSLTGHSVQSRGWSKTPPQMVGDFKGRRGPGSACLHTSSALATNVHRVGHAALGFGRPQRCWRSLRMRARSRRWAASTSGWRAWALRQRR